MVDKKITELTDYTPPIDADLVPIVDITTATTKRITWVNIKATLKTYFDTLYLALTGNQTIAGVKTFSSTPKMDAIAENTGATGVTVDGILLKDSLDVSGIIDKVTAQTKAGVLTLSDTPKMDAIAEKTGATGVTVDGILLKDDLDTSGIVGKTTTQTLTNKRITRREVTIASSATPTPNSDITDIYTITALAEAATFGAPTGTPTQGQFLEYRIKDNATARALNWNAIYRAGTDISLPATTTISKTLRAVFEYNLTDTKWDIVGLVDGI